MVLLELIFSWVHGSFFRFLCGKLEILMVSPNLFLSLFFLCSFTFCWSFLEVLPHVAGWLSEATQLHCDKWLDAPWSTWVFCFWPCM